MRQLSKHMKRLYQKCPDCQARPTVFITSEKIGVCTEHWGELADTDIGWKENIISNKGSKKDSE